MYYRSLKQALKKEGDISGHIKQFSGFSHVNNYISQRQRNIQMIWVQ